MSQDPGPASQQFVNDALTVNDVSLPRFSRTEAVIDAYLERVQILAPPLADVATLLKLAQMHEL